MHDYVVALIGGGMIGLAAVMLMIGQGRVMGVSGIASALLPPYEKNEDLSWRLAFIVGIIAAPLLYIVNNDTPPEISLDAGPALLIGSGLIVGLGTVTGNGCTSGHGVCGLARLSQRSMVATPVFMAAAVGTVFLMKHAIGA